MTGFTKTKSNEATVHAWEVARNTSGLVDVKWKPAARLNTEYRGVDGTPSSQGYIILRNASPLGPVSVPPQFLTEHAETATLIKRDISSEAIRKQLTAEGLEDSLPWLQDCLSTGRIPVMRVLEDSAPPGEIGRLVEIGVGSRTVKVRAMDSPPATTADVFFALPEGLRGKMMARSSLESGVGLAQPVLPQLGQKHKAHHVVILWG